MAGISRSGDAAPVWLSDENGNVLGTAAFPLATSGGGGGGGGGVVTQPTASQLNAQVQGNVAPGSAPSGNPVAMGGTVTTTGFPTVGGNNTRIEQWMGQYGQQVMGAVSFAGGDAIANTVLTSLAPHSGAFTTVRPLASSNFVFNGATWDRARGDTNGAWNVLTGSTAAAVGMTPVVATNATSLVVKASAGNFYGAAIVAGATAGFLIAYNAASAPAAGATLTAAQVLGVVQVSANGSAALGEYTVPDRFSAGVVLLFSTAIATYTVPANTAQFLRGRAM